MSNDITTGTDKQNAWATRLREAACGSVMASVDHAPAEHREVMLRIATRVAEMIMTELPAHHQYWISLRPDADPAWHRGEGRSVIAPLWERACEELGLTRS